MWKQINNGRTLDIKTSEMIDIGVMLLINMSDKLRERTFMTKDEFER